MLSTNDGPRWWALLALGGAVTGAVTLALTGSGWLVATGVGTLLLAVTLISATVRRAVQHAEPTTLEADEGRLTGESPELDRYAAMLSSTDASVMIMSVDGRIIHWNPAAAQLYGYAQDEMLGRSVSIINGPGSPDILEAMEGVVAGEPVAFEAVHLRKDGSKVDTSLTLSRIRNRAGADDGVVGIACSISGQKTRAAEVHQESKLESLGRLSAGLAHEINSPIQFVGDNARFLEEAYEELIRVVEVYRGLLDTSNPIGWMERQERVREAEAGIDFDYLQKEIPSAVEQTLEGIDRVSTIVRAMKTFSHPGHAQQVPADLNEALEATITVTRHQVSEIADLRLDLADLPPVRCNIADLNQVFLNLIVNAADAIEDTGQRGIITVATVLDGDDVVIRISDTGSGIPDDVLPKIFDPFFTTKDVGRGSGQGLPLARGVVQEGHGGRLTVKSIIGEGTTFAVRIPIDGRPERDLTNSEAATAR